MQIYTCCPLKVRSSKQPFLSLVHLHDQQMAKSGLHRHPAEVRHPLQIEALANARRSSGHHAPDRESMAAFLALSRYRM